MACRGVYFALTEDDVKKLISANGDAEVIDVIQEEKLAYRTLVLGERFKNILEKMTEEFRLLREVRGLGLMIGLESRVFVYDVLMKSLEKGLILLYSGRNVIRFLPALVIEMEQLEKAAKILTEIFDEEEKKILKR